MTTERQYSNCKNWDTSLCPHRNDESMRKTVPNWPLVYLGSKEIEEVEKLCLECQKFVPEP